MRIYFGHSKDFDFENEYYKPIENSEVLVTEELLFPHKNNSNIVFSRDFYKSLDLFIAEVSYSAIGLGIELGYVKDDNVPIYCFYKKGFRPSSSLKSVTDNIVEYESLEDLVNKIERAVLDKKNSVRLF